MAPPAASPMALLSFCNLQPCRATLVATGPPELDESDFAAMIGPWRRESTALPGQLRRGSGHVWQGAPGEDGAGKDCTGDAPRRTAESAAKGRSLWQIVVSALGLLVGSGNGAGRTALGVGMPEDGANAPASSAGSLTDAAASEEDRCRRSAEFDPEWRPWCRSPECSPGWEELRWSEVEDEERAAGVAACVRRASRTTEAMRSPGWGVLGIGHGGLPVASRAQLDRHLLRLEEEGSEAAGSIGRHSAPPVCCGAWGLDGGDADASCQDDATWDESVSEASWEPLAQGGTLLDVLELRAELRRQEVLERVAYEEDLMAGIREEVRARKSEFKLLKTGMHTETPAVARLRERWGSGLRARRRRLVQTRQNEEEELLDDIPLTFAPHSESWAVMPAISV